MNSIEQLQQTLTPIFAKETIYKAILFGSYAKGKQTSASDIDIVIDSNGKLLGLDFFRVLDEIVKALNAEVDLFEAAEIVKGSPMEKSVYQEGVVLYERKIA